MSEQFYLLKGTNVIQLKEGEDEKAFVEGILGRVVKNHEDPGRDFVRPDGAKLSVDKAEFDIWNHLLSSTKSANFKIAIQRIFNVQHEAATSQLSDLKTKRMTRHFLVDREEALDAIRRDAKIKEKLRRWLSRSGSRAWMIVGFLMAEDIESRYKNGGRQNMQAGFEIPGPAQGNDTVLKAQAGLEHMTDKDNFIKASKTSVIGIEYLGLQRPRFTRGPDFDMMVRRGPRGPNTFGADDDEEHEEPTADGDIEMISSPAINILRAMGYDELEQESYGDFSFTFDVCSEDDNDEEDEEGDE
ncbi:hypothetical protein BDV11DRAFT_200537 [Aspergillus similis]